MSRSLYKGLYVRYYKVNEKLAYCRSSVVMKGMKDAFCNVHFGNSFKNMHLYEDRLGRRIGEFASTKKLGSLIHKKRDRKGKKKNKK